MRSFSFEFAHQPLEPKRVFRGKRLSLIVVIKSEMQAERRKRNRMRTKRLRYISGIGFYWRAYPETVSTTIVLTVQAK